MDQSHPNGILVVEDDELLNELLCQYLRGQDFLTHGALCVADAFSILAKSPSIDLVLLDYNLGDCTGLDFLISLKQSKGEITPPVIMISTNEDPEFLQQCFSEGIADYIVKPINLSLLALKISTLIKSVSLQRLIQLQNRELERFKREAEREHFIAKNTYEYLLQQNNQVIAGVDVWLKPSSSFSGDIAVAKVAPNGNVFVLLADATGHGLAAAITIMPAVSIFNAMVIKGFDIESIVTEMNYKLVRDTPHDRFIAAVVVQFENAKKTIHVWNGGMPSAYWMREGKIVKLFPSRHMALGILDTDQFESAVETWDVSDAGFFFACSDGLLEATNVDGECFSNERLLSVLHALNGQPGDIIEAISAALVEHTSSDFYADDVSLCVLMPGKINLAG